MLLNIKLKGEKIIMEVYEKINFLIQERDISKREFVKQLLALEPKLKTTGEIPTEQTVYRYLSGDRELKIELIPYIAEVLEIQEQELFNFDLEYASSYNYKKSKEIREIIDLLQYAPANIINVIKEKLLNYKNLYDKNLRELDKL
jgi:transcriptional regulator with XRE-family HTH domain